MTRAQNDEFLRKQLARRNGMSYCVELRHDNGIKDKGQVEGGLDGRGDMIGITGGHDLPEVGYLFEPGAWGKGYATEALKGFIDYYWKLFPEGHLALDGEEKDYLIAFTSPNGVASRRVLHKCGFRHWKFAEEEDEKGEGKEEGEVGQQGVQGERKNETGDTKEKVMLHVWRLERPVVG